MLFEMQSLADIFVFFFCLNARTLVFRMGRGFPFCYNTLLLLLIIYIHSTIWPCSLALLRNDEPVPAALFENNDLIDSIHPEAWKSCSLFADAVGKAATIKTGGFDEGLEGPFQRVNLRNLCHHVW